MDQGRDLIYSYKGPWSQQLTENVSTFPVVQHHPKMTVRSTYLGSEETLEHDTTSSQPRTPANITTQKVLTSGPLLPLEYESILALVDLRRRWSYEPSHALIPVFAYAAFSEAQLLNLMHDQIREEVNALAPEDWSGSISNLQFLLEILERHSSQLENCVKALDHLFDLATPNGNNSFSTRSHPKVSRSSTTSMRSLLDDKKRSNKPDSSFSTYQLSSSGPFSPKGLIDDYNELLQRSYTLCELCRNGIGITINKSMFLESRRAIEQNERLKKLTLLATFFIPLTFSTSVFGMNLRLLGQSDVDVWWFVVFSVPIIILAYIFWIWDTGKLAKYWRQHWRGNMVDTRVWDYIGRLNHLYMNLFPLP